MGAAFSIDRQKGETNEAFVQRAATDAISALVEVIGTASVVQTDPVYGVRTVTIRLVGR